MHLGECSWRFCLLAADQQWVWAWVSQQYLKSIEGSWHSFCDQYSLAWVFQRNLYSIPALLHWPGGLLMLTVVLGCSQNVFAGPWHSREGAGVSLGCSDNPTEFLGCRTYHRRHPWPTNTTLAASQLPAASEVDWSWQQLHNKLLIGFWCPQFVPTDITHVSFRVDATWKNSVNGSVLTVVMFHGQRNGSCDHKSLH